MASTSTARSLKLRKVAVEESWLLTGERRGTLWLARRGARTSGTMATVEFDGRAALAREERHGDVIGFLHTHPVSRAKPSRRDITTMRAWVSAFGKPLLCLIRGSDGLRAFRFDDDTSTEQPVRLVEEFKRGVIVAVD